MSRSDTSPEAMGIQAEIHRRMGGQRRLEITLEMSEAVRALAFARIHRDNPGLTRREVIRSYIREAFGITRPT